jgi:hypothetical protein
MREMGGLVRQVISAANNCQRARMLGWLAESL